MQSSRPFAFVAVSLFALAIGPRSSLAALATAPCRLLQDSLPAAFGDCGSLAVPIDYAHPDGAQLELFFARIPARSATPAADPLVLINGGPGGSAVDLYLQARDAFEPIRRERDILLLDQRGTGRSLSGLDCEVPDDFELVTSTQDEIRATVSQCVAEFAHDPRFFTTSVAVRDLETLREALGIESWNIYGVSYGTRVGQHYLRRYGERVRSLILDGVVPAELTLGPDIARDAQQALEAIFARCTEDPGCAARFPDLLRQFDDVRTRLDSAPVAVSLSHPLTGEIEAFSLGPSELKGVIRLMSYSDTTVALLPLTIAEAAAGNFTPLAAEAMLQISALTDSLGFAMHNSVVCTEDAPWFPEEAEPDTALLYLGATVIDGLRAICETWPRGAIDEDFKLPVISDRPVLLLSGEHDPVTPPANAERLIAAGLSNARHIVGSSRGHGLAGIGCVPRLLREFVNTADPAAIDPACLAKEPPMPFFLSFQGPAP